MRRRTMRAGRRLGPPAGCLLALALAPAVLPAQEDFRNLDPGRPVRVTDAYPLKFLEWEVQAGLRGELADGSRGASAALELSMGAVPNGEIGVELEPALEREEGETRSGLEALSLHLLYNLNQESWHWPGVAVLAEASAPLGGDVGRREWGWSAGVAATRSFASRARVHVNGGYAQSAAVDGGDAWEVGAAVDYPLGVFSPLLVAGLHAEVPTDAGRSRVTAEAGLRVQMTNRVVLDAGLGTRLDGWRDGANVALTVGVSRTFGLSGLMGVPPYPDPMIR